MIDLKDLYSSGDHSMTTDEIVDVILGTKTELEDSLRKIKEEATCVQHDLQKWLNTPEVVVENQPSQIETLNSQSDTL